MLNRKNEQSLYEYTEERSLGEIEKRLLEIERQKPHIKDESEKKIVSDEESLLIRRRQFILDRRESWEARIFWSAIIPILVSIATTFLTIYAS